jgi:hypothetical protein
MLHEHLAHEEAEIPPSNEAPEDSFFKTLGKIFTLGGDDDASADAPPPAKEKSQEQTGKNEQAQEV